MSDVRPELLTNVGPDMNSALARRHVYFSIFVAVTIIVFWRFVSSLIAYSLNHESCSHIVLVPLISLYLICADRRKIFDVTSPAMGIGGALVAIGIASYWAIKLLANLQDGNQLSAAVVSLVLIWTGGFLFCYGVKPSRAAAFPLLFLFLMVPLPDPLLSWTIYRLQQGSTEISYLLFKAVGIPVLKQGFILSVPGVAIEVATECSGIRSSIALFITCLLAAHLYLRTFWKVLFFVLLVFPLAILKNGIRIVTLTLLSIYVDPGFLRGSFHRDGGFVFFLLALLILFPVFLLLERSESQRQTASPAT